MPKKTSGKTPRNSGGRITPERAEDPSLEELMEQARNMVDGRVANFWEHEGAQRAGEGTFSPTTPAIADNSEEGENNPSLNTDRDDSNKDDEPVDYSSFLSSKYGDDVPYGASFDPSLGSGTSRPDEAPMPSIPSGAPVSLHDGTYPRMTEEDIQEGREANGIVESATTDTHQAAPRPAYPPFSEAHARDDVRAPVAAPGGGASAGPDLRPSPPVAPDHSRVFDDLFGGLFQPPGRRTFIPSEPPRDSEPFDPTYGGAIRAVQYPDLWTTFSGTDTEPAEPTTDIPKPNDIAAPDNNGDVTSREHTLNNDLAPNTPPEVTITGLPNDVAATHPAPTPPQAPAMHPTVPTPETGSGNGHAGQGEDTNGLGTTDGLAEEDVFPEDPISIIINGKVIHCKNFNGDAHEWHEFVAESHITGDELVKECNIS